MSSASGTGRARSGSALRVTALVVAVLLACSGVAAEDQACEGPAPLVTAVRLRADRWIDEAGLLRRAGIADTPFRWDAERQAEVRERLMKTRLFRSIEPRLSAQDTSCVLAIELNHRRTVGSLEVEGVAPSRLAVLAAFWKWVTLRGEDDPLPSEREVYRLIPTRPGLFFDEEALDRGTQRILARYHAVGHQAASVGTRVRKEAGEAQITVFVDPGPALLVTGTVVRCADPDAARIVQATLQRRLGTRRVKRLDRIARREVLADLRRAGYFDAQATVTWHTIDEAAGELRAVVEAGPHQELEVVGNESVDRDELIDEQRLFERVVLTENTWRQVADKIRDEYQERGYYEVSVDLEIIDRERVVFSVTEGQRFEVTRVRLEGNASVEEDDILAVLETGRRRWFSIVRPPRVGEAALEADAGRIADLYDRRGFESAAVRSSVSLDRERGGAEVLFSIDEGTRTLVRSITIDSGSRTLLERPEGARVGEPLDVSALQEERKRYTSVMQRRGYLDARVAFTVERETSAETVDAAVVWRIRPGPLHRIGDIVVEDNLEAQFVVVDRDLPFETGDVLEPDALLDAQQDVQRNGIFRSVSIYPVPRDDVETAKRTESSSTAGGGENGEAEDGEVESESEQSEREEVLEVDRDVAVRVVARPPGRIAYGFGYDTLQGLTAFGELQFANLNHRAQKIRIRGQIGFEPTDSGEPTQYLATAGFSEPRLLEGPWEWHVNTIAEKTTRTIDQYNVERFGGATGGSRLIAEGLRFGADIQVEYDSVFDVEPIPFRSLDETDTWTTALSPFLIYDGRDSPFNPRSGFLESLRLRYSVPGISDNDLIEVNAQHIHLVPLWSDVVFVYSLGVGWVKSLAGDPIVPIRQRYFIGGGESVRGFAVNSLGPYDGQGNEVGGDLAIVAKSELRIPLIWGFEGVVFLDGGGNYLLDCDRDCRAGDPNVPDSQVRDAAATFDNFRWASGLGLRYLTPVGPISVDYGFKLDRRTRELSGDRRERESLGEFSINFGARF